MFSDLRAFLAALSERGKLREVKGAHWDLEIGTLNELVSERQGPGLLFDQVPGYPPGFRIATNLLHHRLGQKLALGLDETLSDLEVVRAWKDKMNGFVPVAPQEVDQGPILENCLSGPEVDLFKIPAPRWHMHDGGRYIGTGVITVTRDPEEGWVNLGTYRVMIHDAQTLSFYVSPGKHARIMREKYWARGEPCPVAMSFGQDPLLFCLSTIPLPWGTSEYDVAGFLRSEPVQVVKGRATGLPLPATAEIVAEGFAPPPAEDSRPEGPFGEWQGYYASGSREEPVVRVQNLYFRHEPILFGQPPVKPPVNTWFPIPVHTASTLWDRLEKSGMTGLRGVYVHGPGNRVIAVVSLRQMYPGHARQLATLAGAFLQGGACTGRYIITVDEDIDPSNLEEVLWAVCTRADPEKALSVVPGFLTSPLDPMLSPEARRRQELTTAKVFIDACWPYHWKDKAPPVNRASDELRREVRTKWPELFEEV